MLSARGGWSDWAIGDDGQPVPVGHWWETPETYRLWARQVRHPEIRRVGRTVLKRRRHPVVWVSTVFLGVPAPVWGRQGIEPALWETMVFVDRPSEALLEWIDTHWRYQSEAAAREGHRRVVYAVARALGIVAPKSDTAMGFAQADEHRQRLIKETA